MKNEFKCAICKIEPEELYSFTVYHPKHYRFDKEYCKQCFDKKDTESALKEIYNVSEKSEVVGQDVLQ
jgi:hypothetical protein